MQLTENIGHQKSPYAHHRTTLSGYIFATINNPKKNLLNNNISSTFPHNMVNFGRLMAEIGRRAGGTPGNFNGLASWLRYCTDVAQRKSTIFCMMCSSLLGWYTIFGASCPLTEVCHVQNSLCVQVLHSLTLASLLHDTQAVVVVVVCFTCDVMSAT